MSFLLAEDLEAKAKELKTKAPKGFRAMAGMLFYSSAGFEC